MNTIPLSHNVTTEKAVVIIDKELEYRTTYAYNKPTKEEAEAYNKHTKQEDKLLSQ